MLAVTLVTMSARSEGFDPSYAIDAVLAGLGRGLEKSVSSLETPESQLELLQGRTPEETEAIVGDALSELETGRAETLIVRLAKVWGDARFRELERYETWCDCMKTDEDRALSRRLIEKRNPTLAARIDEMHASGKHVFAAVGSLHMIGDQGIPALMAARGYSVERIEFKAR
jgi:uncharacterized protein